MGDPLVLTDCRILAGGNDFSGDMNAVALEYGVDLHDGTTFGKTTRINKPGLKSVVASSEGLYDPNGPTASDAVIFTEVGGTGEVAVTISPTSADGEIAFMFRAVHGEYGPSGEMGDLAAFSVTFEGADGVPHIRGRVLRAALRDEDTGDFTNSATATGTGTARQQGAVAAGKKLYGALHVLSGSGTLDVVVQSDDGAGFASPTTRLTFAQKSAAGWDWQELAGPITDTWYRVSFTIGGITPSFDFVVAIGIA